MIKAALAAVVAIFATVGSLQAAEWYVLKGGEGCFVSDRKAEAGEGEMGPPHATRAEATEAIGSIAACQTANTDPDPDDEGGPGGER